ncbi:MAG: hypothetical protein V1740_00800 [Candidatus Woesearchaeota archaeon]
MIPEKTIKEFYLIDLILGSILLCLNLFSIYINRFSSLLGLVVVICSFIGYLVTERYYDKIVYGFNGKKKNDWKGKERDGKRKKKS